jgi:alpha-L-rhamnosidase
LADGSLPVIVPSAGWGYGWSPCSPAPEWTTYYPVLVDALVNEYGLDLWPLHRDGVVAYLRYELGRLDEDGVAVGILGDYLSPGTGGPPPEDVRMESSMALWHALDVTSHALAGSPEELEFAAARDRLAEAVNRTWLDAERGRYSPMALVGSRVQQPAESDDIGYRQTPNVLALDAGIVPEQHRDAVLRNLIDDIYARGGHHNMGCIGMSRLCSVLVRQGRGDVALTVATNPTGPSWEAWRRAGHETLLEMWTEPVRSRAHYFHGAGLRFVEDDLVGLRRLAPAWKRFEVMPALVDGLDHAECRRSDIRAGWHRLGARVAVHVMVPDDAVAVVILPSGTTHEVGSGSHEWIEGTH